MTSTSLHIRSIAAASALTAIFCASAETSLPTVTIMGKTFYTYVAKKGESLFGIANKFGWNPDVLARTNREVDTPLDNGTLIYYPAPKPQKENKKPSPVADRTSADTTQEESPVTVVDHSDIQTTPATGDAEEGIVYHKVKHDESLYGIAQEYETTIEDLYKLNPGISYDDPETGETLRVKVGSRNEQAVARIVEERQVGSLTNYKVRRGDNWASVAEAKGVSVELLKEANPGISRLKRGNIISIPNVETVEVERMVVEQDPREMTEDGRRELYNEVHSLDCKIYDADGNINPNTISVAIVLSDPESNKDMEFARGAILAVDNMKTRSFATRLTVIDGSQSETEVIGALEGFAPTLVVTTADKGLPAYLTAYVKENSRHLVNAFDVKNEAYLENPYVIQYLAPTSYFNDEVASYITDTYAGYNLIVAGKMDGNDTMGESILRQHIELSGEMPQEVPAEEIGDMILPDEEGRYIIYATQSRKDDVKSMLDRISALRERNPMAEIRVIGRPNWITMADALRESFDDNGLLLPSRFYFNADEYASKDFINNFRTLYGHTPMKSYPVYSATAYDILSYFLPNISTTGGDFNASFRDQATLQSPISLERVNNWGGMVNPSVYLIEFRPLGGSKKIILNPSED